MKDFNYYLDYYNLTAQETSIDNEYLAVAYTDDDYFRAIRFDWEEKTGMRVKIINFYDTVYRELDRHPNDLYVLVSDEWGNPGEEVIQTGREWLTFLDECFGPDASLTPMADAPIEPID